MPSKEVKVLLDEEYGYRMWEWRTGMSEEQLIAWWKAQPSMKDHYFNPNTTLPGKIKRVEARAPKRGEWTGHIHMDDDSFLKSPDGVEYVHAGYETTTSI